MDKIAIAVMSSSVSVIVVTLGYVFSKWKEREADWRKKKLDMYHALFDSISGIVRGDSTPEAQKSFAKSCNTIGLIASADVIKALQKFQLAAQTRGNFDITAHDKALTELLLSVRDDLGLPLKSKDFVYRLWSSGTSEENAQQGASPDAPESARR